MQVVARWAAKTGIAHSNYVRASKAANEDVYVGTFRQGHPDREVGPQSRGSRARDSLAADEETQVNSRGTPTCRKEAHRV